MDRRILGQSMIPYLSYHPFQYKKPQIVLEMERAVLVLLQDVQTTSDLDVDCNDLLKELME